MQPIVKTWYDYLAAGKLMGLKCKRCGAVHFPPYAICRECSGTEMEWVVMSGFGTVNEIKLCSIPDRWLEEYAPYYHGIGVTDEGSYFESMIVGLDVDPDEIFEKYIKKAPLRAKLEIQQRDGYEFPVFRIVE